ncbi:MAG: DNA-binding protein [Candidatus Zixiibacteriota bacterium]|nr:MAG: DNA-binding protein [candidate division Zixibacteria bacterium]
MPAVVGKGIGVESLLSIKDLSTLLKVPVSWIYDRTRKGSVEQIPHYKIGKYVRFNQEEVLVYLSKKSCGQRAK